MGNDIQRVYKFLNTQTNWQKDADINKDGTIVRSELKSFLEKNIEWDGETSESGKNDIINKFWNSIDTNKTDFIDGTNFKNKNAFDSKEIENLQNNMEIYQILENFLSTISAPDVLNNTNDWKKYVTEDLGKLFENYTQNFGKIEDFEAYLKQNAPAIQQKVTAEICSNEYLNNEMGSFIQEYSYSYEDDETLQNLIKNFTDNIPAQMSDIEIKENIQNIINAYMATAGLKESNNFDLTAYGYNIEDTTPLNNLQKSILQASIKLKLEEIKNQEDYNTNNVAYNNAITSFIKNLLSNATNADYATLQNFEYEEFLNSNEYKNTKNSIDAKALIQSDEFYNKISTEISTYTADYIKNNRRYNSTIQNIEKELAEKINNGEFLDENGNLDKNAATDWIFAEIQTNILNLYNNNLKNLSLNDINKVYEQAYVGAENETDNSISNNNHKKAALAYCEAIINKDDKYEEFIKTIFGEDYKDAINELTPFEIKNKIAEVQDLIFDYSDVTNLTLNESSWNNLNSVKINKGNSKTYNITPTFTSNSGESRIISNDRISYQSSNTNLATINNNGNVTISGAYIGTHSVTLTILVDNVKVGEKEVTISCSNTSSTSSSGTSTNSTRGNVGIKPYQPTFTDYRTGEKIQTHPYPTTNVKAEKTLR